jgi:hypothetical protein
MTIRHAVATFGVLVGIVLAARADEPAPPKGPSALDTALGAATAVARGATVANVVPATFRAQLVVDNRFKQMVKEADGTESLDPRNRTGKIHCLVCEYGLSPVVAVFVRSDLKDAKAEGGLGKLIKGVDALVPKYRSDKLAAFAMYLKLAGGPKLVTVKAPDGSDEKVEAAKEYPDDEKRDAYVKEVKDFATALAADNVPFGLAPTTSPSVTAFGIGEDAPVTVIIYNRLRMARRWELKLDDLTDEKIGEILAAAEEMIAGKKKE